MAATALIKFTQGSTVGADGEALLGVVGTEVHLSNTDDTDVLSWQIDLVYVDARSALTTASPFAYSDSSSTPSANFTPDVPGSYRLVLKVWAVASRVGDPSDIDIRVFSVAEGNNCIVPPSQLWPLPLPDTRSGEYGAKPNELNFSGQQQGWAGTGSDGLLNYVLRKVDALDTGIACVLYVQPDVGSEVQEEFQTGSAASPFVGVQAALDVVNANTNTAITSWLIVLAPGVYTETCTLEPELASLSDMHVTFFAGFGGSEYAVLDDLTLVASKLGGQCNYTFMGVHLAGSLRLQRSTTGATVTTHLELIDTICLDPHANGLSAGDVLTVSVRGSQVPVLHDASKDYYTSLLGDFSCTSALCNVYMSGARLGGDLTVSGVAALTNVGISANVVLTALAIQLIDSGHVSAGSGMLFPTGTDYLVSMDNASFCRMLKMGTRLSVYSHIRSASGSEFVYELDAIGTTTDVVDQQLFAWNLSKWPAGILVGVRADVTVYNKNTLTDYGIFARVALVHSQLINYAFVVSLAKEGEVVYSGSAPGVASDHSVRLAVQGTNVVLLCTPSSSTADLGNSWKVTLRFSINKAA